MGFGGDDRAGLRGERERGREFRADRVLVDPDGDLAVEFDELRSELGNVSSTKLLGFVYIA